MNGADWKVRSGHYAPTTEFPYIPGRDFSGVVSALGAGVTDFKVGDAVFGVVRTEWRTAATRKRSRSRRRSWRRKPDSLSHVEAAALALIGLTALVSVEDTLKLKAGETILIQGGAGGVASFAMQVAKHIGARVITTASAANHDYVRKPRRRPGHRLQQAGLHQGGVRAWTRCSTPSAAEVVEALVRRAAAGRTRRVHRLGTNGAVLAARRRHFAAPEGRARPPASRADRRAGHQAAPCACRRSRSTRCRRRPRRTG